MSVIDLTIKKPNNEAVLIKEILRKDIGDLSESEKFEIFSFEQILKDQDLSEDQINSGRVDGPNDGGIDGIFIFLNREELVTETPSKEYLESLGKKPVLELHIIQSKTTQSFEESVIEKFDNHSSMLFDLETEKKDLLTSFNSAVLEKIYIFREIYKNLGDKLPDTHIKFHYCSLGRFIDKKIIIKSKHLERKVKKLLPDTDVTVQFYSAEDLLRLFRKEPSRSLSLNIAEIIFRGSSDYVLLSDLSDYFDFIKDEDGKLRYYLFDSNVRDFQGKNEVNKDINKSLTENTDIDFWWLNNGVTILAKKGVIRGGKVLYLEEVQIVNGLQTTRCVYEYLNNKENIRKEKNLKNKRSLLIKVITDQSDLVRDRVIKATNFQTKVSDASLRATDDFQRNLENYLENYNWYYDRRKNYYKNLNKPKDRIVSISYVAQAIMALVLKQPHVARGRPAGLIKNDQSYNQMFGGQMSFIVYLKCIEVIRLVEKTIRNIKSRTSFRDINNFRFHIGTLFLGKIIGNKEYSTSDIIDLDILKLKNPNQTIKDISVDIIKMANMYSRKNKQTLDNTAKSKDFYDSL